jgi:hypothetical protein
MVFLTLCLFSSCAEVAPYMGSPKMYKSSEDEGVARHKARTERYKTEQHDQQLSRKREDARNQKAIDEINGNGTLNSAPSPDGIAGGFPIVLINTTDNYLLITITKRGVGPWGEKWYFEIGKRDHREYKLEIGNYKITWQAKTINYFTPAYSQVCHGTFPVISSPKFHYDATGKDYYGGYIFRP